MSNGIKWKRIRPGLYRLYVDGTAWGMVERGAETGEWWWEAWPNCESTTGRSRTLKYAKEAVAFEVDNA